MSATRERVGKPRYLGSQRMRSSLRTERIRKRRAMTLVRRMFDGTTLSDHGLLKYRISRAKNGTENPFETIDEWLDSLVELGAGSRPFDLVIEYVQAKRDTRIDPPTDTSDEALLAASVAETEAQCSTDVVQQMLAGRWFQNGVALKAIACIDRHNIRLRNLRALLLLRLEREQ